MKKYLWAGIIVVLFMFSCVEEYEHKITGGSNFLIVEGMITNSNEPYEVILTRTSNLNDNSVIYETNANVVISDSKGNSITLNEVTEGIYTTNPAEFIGELGESYILTIHTENGDVFESDQVTLNEVLGIDSAYITLNEEYNYNEDNYERGIDINIATEEWDENQEYYLKWDYIETWKLFPTYSVMGNEDIPHIPCYNIIKSNEIITDNTTLYSSNKINKKKIVYLNENDTRPYFGYSILIRQTTLNESVFQFWKMLEENTEENGNVFDKIPYNAVSNINCITNDDVRVLGYFNASQVSEKRISFKPSIMGIKFRNFYDNCNLLSYSTEEFEIFLSYIHKDSSDVYIYDIVEGQVMFFTNRRCVDCSVNSTTTEKPDYWPYD